MSDYERLIKEYDELTRGFINEMLLDALNEKIEELEECLDLSLE
jgi:hypothetical protein